MSKDIHCKNCGLTPCRCPICSNCLCRLRDNDKHGLCVECRRNGICPTSDLPPPPPPDPSDEPIKKSKSLYQLYPSRPPYCPMEDCTCIVHSMDADEPYKPGRSIFCMGLIKEPVDQEWFGERHVNDIFQCTWFPRGWDRSIINIQDIEIQLVLLLKVYQQKNDGQAINPTWLLRKAGWTDIANELQEDVNLDKMHKDGNIKVFIDNVEHEVSKTPLGAHLYNICARYDFNLYLEKETTDDVMILRDRCITLKDGDRIYSITKED